MCSKELLVSGWCKTVRMLNELLKAHACVKTHICTYISVSQKKKVKQIYGLK